MSTTPSRSGRPDDHHREGGRPARQDHRVSWAYAKQLSEADFSVPQSLILQMTRFGMNVRLVHPPEFKLMPDIVQQAKDNVR
jgi:ornithine carbamoyltransferase